MPEIAVHCVCVLTAVAHPSDYIMDLMHTINLFKRLVLLIFGIVLIATSGSNCSPGLAIQEFSRSEWRDLTYVEWKNSQLPGGRMISMPGSNFWPILWIATVTILVIYDTMRCALVVSSRWHRYQNQLDMTWHIVAYVPVPLIFVGTSLTLGHTDALLLINIVILAFISGVCGTILEQIRCFVNPGTISGMPNGVIYMLLGIHDISLIIASQLVVMPFMSSFFSSNDTPSHTQMLTFTLHSFMVLCLTITNYHHHRLCTIFEQKWKHTQSTCDWTTNHTAEVVENNHKKSDNEPDYQNDNMLYKAGYECSPYECTPYDPNTAVVRVVDGDKCVTTIKLTEQFRSINRAPWTGMHVSLAGTDSQHGIHTDDEDIKKTRRRTGALLEWRRYYLVNMLINALLLIHILSLTMDGVDGCA